MSSHRPPKAMLELSTTRARAERNGGSMTHPIVLQIKLLVGECDFEVKNVKPPFILTRSCVLWGAVLPCLEPSKGLLDFPKPQARKDRFQFLFNSGPPFTFDKSLSLFSGNVGGCVNSSLLVSCRHIHWAIVGI